MSELDTVTQWYILCGYVFVIGLCVGSFLNVVIYRLPIMLEREWTINALDFLQLNRYSPVDKPAFNLAVPRSACPVCNNQIELWQNIPIVSYLFLKGRCGFCSTPISIRYPVVELITGLLSIAAFVRFGFTVEFLAFLFLTFCLVALTGIDFDHQLLPDVITLPLIWMGLLLNSQHVFVDLASAVYGAAAAYLSLYIIFEVYRFITGKVGMGFGDFKLFAVFGAWFGWTALPGILFLSAAIGSIVGIVMMLSKGYGRDSRLAFGPYLAIAGWLCIVYPETFVFANWIK